VIVNKSLRDECFTIALCEKIAPLRFFHRGGRKNWQRAKIGGWRKKGRADREGDRENTSKTNTSKTT